LTYLHVILENISTSQFSIKASEVAEGEMVTENFISSKARPVAGTLKVNANLSSTDKETLISVFLWSNIE